MRYCNHNYDGQHHTQPQQTQNTKQCIPMTITIFQMKTKRSTIHFFTTTENNSAITK